MSIEISKNNLYIRNKETGMLDPIYIFIDGRGDGLTSFYEERVQELERMLSISNNTLSALDNNKMNSSLGVENSGKVLAVNENGFVYPMSLDSDLSDNTVKNMVDDYIRSGAVENYLEDNDVTTGLPEDVVLYENDENSEDQYLVDQLMLDKLELESDGEFIYLKYGNAILGKVDAYAGGSGTIFCRGISINGGNVSLNLNTTDVFLDTTVTPQECTQTVRWSTSNRNIVNIDQDGNLTLVSAGKATITAKCGNYSSSIEVTVYDPIISSELYSIRRGFAINVSAATRTIYMQSTRSYFTTRPYTAETPFAAKSNTDYTVSCPLYNGTKPVSIRVLTYTQDANGVWNVLREPTQGWKSIAGDGFTFNTQEGTAFEFNVAMIEPDVEITEQVATWLMNNITVKEE